MSAFEFFFSFYGLLLGLSLAAIATGLATAVQHRHSVKIGYLTPLLATFVVLDIASFWDFAWTVFRDAPFSYGLLVAGLIIAVVYFIAASLVFPHTIEDDMRLDDNFWSNKRTVLLLTTLANLLALGIAIPFVINLPGGETTLFSYAVTCGLYLVLVLPAAFARKPRLFNVALGLHIAIYLLIAATTVQLPAAPVSGPPVAASAQPAP